VPNTRIGHLSELMPQFSQRHITARKALKQLKINFTCDSIGLRVPEQLLKRV
jgi:hypothetical protein